jgi:TatA/E family protein of Tat protein translocase
MGLGTPELIVIFFVALVVFGPRKLPELGRSLGKSLSEFKRASNELKNTLDDEIRLEEHREQAAKHPPAPPLPPPAATSSSDVSDELENQDSYETPPSHAGEVVARGEKSA